ncbi:gamma-glutamyl-gamma-aminobutyrate hydrolase family protein [bacterium]|nr:gamma-glutamyl-gamma-aminobutyrate hydrolase family protein [bacterium]
MKRPVVGIEADVAVSPKDGRRFAKVYEAYYEAVHEGGGFPVLLPPLAGREHLERALELVSAVVFPGGDDMPSQEYGQKPFVSPDSTAIDGERFRFGRELVREATSRALPVLGVCYGAQLLNVAHGGDMVQDIPLLVPGALEHRKIEHKDGSHDVEVEPGSRLAALLGARRLRVNSAHHQAIGRVGKGLRVVARSPDGVIEALEGEADGVFLLGVQWHPERMGAGNAGWGIFSALVQAAREGKRRD